MRIACLLALLVAMAVPQLSLEAAQPRWTPMEIFRRVEADPEKVYALSDVQGPWMIMAATFSGEEAQNQARELVYELRHRYKLPAYMHQMTFEFANEEEQAVRDRYGMPKSQRYRVEQMDEIGVLVGDFPAVDDQDAQRILEKIKSIEPDCLNLELRVKSGKSESRSLAALRIMQEAVRLPGVGGEKPRGPMAHAFVTTNPLLPKDYFTGNGVDELVLRMNEPVEFCLLDCPGKFTVQVATFTGHSAVDPKTIRAVESGKKMPSRLADAADKAHRLTIALRKNGHEAYEFHDRKSSIVTVGSFEFVGTPRNDGRLEINPQIHSIMQTFGAEKVAMPGDPTPRVGQPKSLDGIPFDPQPIPVEAPRRPISAAYQRPMLGRR